MSYILDALKKKESDKTEQIPDIHSQHFIRENDDKKVKSLLWVKLTFIGLVMLLVVALSIIGYKWISKSEAAPKPSSQIPKKQPVAERKSDNDVNLNSNSYLVVEEKPILRQEPVVKKIPQNQRKPVKAEKSITEKKAQAKNSIAANNTHNEHTSAQSDLSQLPQMRYTTHVYSDKPKDRFVMLNGKTYNIGQKSPNGVLIVDILENDLLLKYKNRNYKVPALNDIE